MNTLKKISKKISTLMTKSWKWMGCHKTLVIMLGIVVLTTRPHIAVAQSLDTIVSSPDVQRIYQQMVSALIAVMGFLQSLLNYVLLLNGALLKNDLLYSAGMEETMYAIWTNIRNLVNILFVVVLLGIAFYNIVGGKAQDYQLKEIIPKFVLALIAVNFSFLVVKVAVDGVAVVTNAMFALPGAVQRDLQESDSFQFKVCEFYYGKNQTEYEDNLKTADPKSDSYDATQALCVKTKTFSKKGKEYFATYGSHNAAIVLAINMANISNIDKVQLGKKLEMSALFINTLMSVFLYIIYGAAFVALTIILFVRLITLWVTIVLSPLIVLRYVLPESIKSAIGGGDDLSKQFVQNAIAPIPIALMMSIGFIMLDSLKKANFKSVTLATDALGTNLFTSGLNTLQDLIVAFAMVGIIWGAVFAAAKGTSADSVIEGMKSAMEGAGKFLIKAPLKYAPLFPAYGIKDEHGDPVKVSLGAALGAAGRLPQALDDKQNEDVGKLMKYITGQDGRKNEKQIKTASTPKDAIQAFTNASEERQKSKDFQKDIFRKFDDNKSWKNSTDFDWNIKFKDKDGKTPISKEQFLKALQTGDANPDTVREWIEASRKKHNIVPQLEGDPSAPSSTPGTPAAGTPPAGTGMDINKAKGILENSEFNAQKHVLSTAQQKDLEQLRQNLAKAKDEKGIQASLAKADATLQDLDAVAQDSRDFNKDIGEIYATGTPQEKKQKTDDRIKEYRQKVVDRMKIKEPKANPADLEQRANKVIFRNIKGLPPDLQQAPEAQKVMTSVGSNATDLTTPPDPVVVGTPTPPPKKP